MNYLFSVTASLLLFALVAFVLNESMSIPDVHISYSTEECVDVINYDKDDNYSCENLPSKFNHILVK
jgi:hypothetical protein